MATDQKVVVTNEARSGRTVMASIAALGAAILASSCCLPRLAFLFAGGAAGSSAFFVKLRPVLVVASVLSIAYGFYQARKAKQCNRPPGRLSRALLWFSATVVVVFTFFPQAMANFVADLL